MGPPPDGAIRALVSDRVRLPDDAGGGWRPAAIWLGGGPEIVAVAAGAEAVDDLRAQGAGRIDDFGNRPISPAFVNVHTHLALAFLRGPAVSEAAAGNLVERLFYVREAALFPEDVRAFTRMGAFESLLAGVGLVWDHYYYAEAVAAGLGDVGLAGVVAPTLQDLAGPGADRWEAGLATTATLSDDRDLARAGIFAAVGPHATDTVSGGLWEAATRLAADRALPVHAHLAQSAEEVERVRAREGASPLRWLHGLGVLAEAPATVFAHGLYLRRDELPTLTTPRHLMAHCPSAQAVFGFPGPARAWAEAGVRFAVATDSAAGNDSMSLQKELRVTAGARTSDLVGHPRYQAYLDGAGSPGEIDRTRTERHGDAAGGLGDPAQLLDRVWALPGSHHPAFRAGAIAPGALANLVVWNHEHPAMWPATDLDRALAYGDTTGAIHGMVVAGRDVGVAGDFQRSLIGSDDYAAARAEADARLEALNRRC